MKIDEGRCVYVVYSPLMKLTKIGASENVETRKCQLELACGHPLVLIYASKHLICAEKYEVETHNEFKEYRKIGEWFDIEDHEKVIAFIKNAILSATEDPIIENYKKGISITKLAMEFQVTRQAILARLKKYGVYDNKGHIYERLVLNTSQVIPKEIEKQHISTIEDKYDDTMYLDGEEPTLPLKGLKRIEPNINSNGEWFQVSFFKDGEFIYSYTRDIIKARAYVQGVRAGDYANQNKH